MAAEAARHNNNNIDPPIDYERLFHLVTFQGESTLLDLVDSDGRVLDFGLEHDGVILESIHNPSNLRSYIEGLGVVPTVVRVVQDRPTEAGGYTRVA